MVKDICVMESYTDNQSGEEKTSWNRVGILIEKNNKQYVKLFHMPNVLASVFDQKKKGQQPNQQTEGSVNL